MAGHNNNFILDLNLESTGVGSAEAFSSPSSQEVPATPQRGDGHLEPLLGSIATPQPSPTNLLTHQPGSESDDLTDIVTPVLRRHATYQTGSPPDHSTPQPIWTPMPINGSLSPIHIPETPLSSRGHGRGLSGTQPRFNELLSGAEDLAMVPRSLFKVLPPIPRESSFSTSPISSTTLSMTLDTEEKDRFRDGDDDEDDSLEGYTSTGTPMPRHRCTLRCIRGPWDCPHAPEPLKN